MRRIFLILAISLGVAACGTTPPSIRYYRLDAGVAVPQGASQPLQHELQLAPLRLASQLDSTNLVFELPGQELQFAEYHRWAGTLDDQLEQLTRDGLSARLPGWVMRDESGGDRLEIRVQQFGGRHDGHAVLSGRWRLLGADGKVKLDRLFHDARPLPADGYSALVGELSLGWGELLDQISREVARP